MGTLVTKILCHPQQGGPFCVWHRDQGVYACYFSTEASPPKPASLGIEHRGLTDVAALVWQPVVQVVGELVEDVQVFGEFNDDGEVI